MHNIDKVIPTAARVAVGASSSSSGKRSKKKGGFSMSSYEYEEPEPMPPVMPPAGKAPWIYVENSTFGEGFEKLLNSNCFADTRFLIFDTQEQIEREIMCHEQVLACSPSKVIESLFDEILQAKLDGSIDNIMKKVNEGRVPGFSSMKLSEDNLFVEIKLSNTISYLSFMSLLEVLYYGQSKTLNSKKSDSKFLKQALNTASVFECEYFENMVNNIESGLEEVFNESLGTYLNDELGKKAKDKFFGKQEHADVKLNFGERSLYGHKLFLSVNCEVFKRMFEGDFVENASGSMSQVDMAEGQIDLTDENQVTMRISEYQALLEYLYTAHSSIDENNAVGLLSLANQYGMSGLTCMCEIFISKTIDKAVSKGIEKADIDVIGLLLLAQTFEANQLAQFCLHFIASNYGPMSARKEWELLKGDNKKYVEEKKWPPDSYFKQVAEYEKKHEVYMKKQKKKQKKESSNNTEVVEDDKKKDCSIQ